MFFALQEMHETIEFDLAVDLLMSQLIADASE